MRSSRAAALVLASACVLGDAAPSQAPNAKAQKRDKPASAAAPTPLDTARKLARTRFRSWVYKTKKSAESIDCTEFVLAVTNEFAASKRRSLTRAQRRTLAVATVTLAQLDALVEKGAPEIRGVQSALVDAGFGRAVRAQDARPGDFIQYWYPTSRGWRGHAGLIEAVTEDAKAGTKTLHVFGSHKSSLRVRADGQDIPVARGGIGSGPRLVIPRDPAKPSRYKIYIARWTAAASKAKPGKKPAGAPEAGKPVRKSSDK